MKFALIGFGKMGQTIKRLAEAGGDTIGLVIDWNNKAELTSENLRNVDVAIEFTQPSTAFENVRTCLEAGIPVVSGTTGWLDKLPTAREICESSKGAFFYASNYSIGVNIFFAINKYLSSLMATQTDYKASVEEIHHLQKIDHPSGTAITIAEGVFEKVKYLHDWKTFLKTADTLEIPTEPGVLPIISKREANVPGTHTVTWQSEIDTIQISHVAHSREGFATGAIAAAKWLVGKQGCFGMNDMLGF